MPRPGGAERAPRGTRAAVVGGGIAGVAAATVLCERGVDVTLIEKEPGLGGRAGGFKSTLVTGEAFEMERGFHAFFAQYYNLRSLLRRFDPQLSFLRRLDDYPILGPSGMVQSFAGLPKMPPLPVLALAWRSPYLHASEVVRTNARAALEMLRFDAERTYRRFDAMRASTYLDSLAFPPDARRMLFNVFSHSFFNPESEMSAAELLMMFHFYMTGNVEGLIFDVARRPMPAAIWNPFSSWLCDRGVRVRTGALALRVDRSGASRFRVTHSGGQDEVDLLVLALDVASLQKLVTGSPDLGPLAARVATLGVTRPFAVWRLWLDRALAPHRAPFAGTTGVGLLDNISIYDRFQDESQAWARAHGGSVVELHAYAVPPGIDEDALKADLLTSFHSFYGEAAESRIVDQVFLLRQDCPAFPPGGHVVRPGVETPLAGLALAGDFVAMPIPCALMERAAASGFLAANTVLAPLGVMAQPLRSVPSQGLLSPLRIGRSALAQNTHP